MGDTLKNVPNVHDAFCKVVNWLELDKLMSPQMVQALKQRFEAAVQNPESTMLVLSTSKNLVQIFDGKAVCQRLDEGVPIPQTLKPFLEVSNLFAACFTGIEGERRTRYQQRANDSYQAADDDMRMALE